MELDIKEAKALAEASANVMAEFDVKPDPRFIAVAGLIATASSIYGPRIIAIRMRRENAKKDTPPKNTAQFDQTTNGIDPSAYKLGG